MTRKSTARFADLQLRLFVWLLLRLRRMSWFRAMCRHPAMQRINAGFFVRPWLTDIGCGLVALWWGIWVGIHHEQAVLGGGFRVFAQIMPALTGIIALVGAAQVWVAITKNISARQIVSLTFITLWAGIASGVSSPSGQAAYVGYALLNLLILVRAF